MVSRWQDMLKKYWRKFIHAYERVQVELHGKYSVERVAQVHAYARTHSTLQCVVVLLATPLPCIAVIVLTDLVPLESPDEGYTRNHVFWARVFVVTFAVAAALLDQMRRFVVGLPLSTRVLLTVCMIIGVCTTAYVYAIASLVGFPIPFTIIACAPCSTLLLAATGLILWGRLLRASQLIRHDVSAYIKIMNVQVTLTVIYPAYNFLFVRLGGVEQTVLALLLPLLKLLAKNAMSLVFVPRLEDFKPEVVIFNVEVFHALFVSCLMQGSRSWAATIALMGVDFVHAWFSVFDINAQLRSIETMEDKLRVAQTQLNTAGKPVAQTQLNTAGKPKELASSKSLTLIEKAMYYAHHDDTVRRDPSIRLRSASAVAATGLVAVFPANLAGPPAHELAMPSPFGSGKASTRALQTETYAGPPAEDLSSVRQRSSLARFPPNRELSEFVNLFNHVPEDTRNVLNVLTTHERVEYVASILKVLHIAEFLLLIEFVEVIVPIVYCVYLSAMFYLPNRVYYPQLASMDSHSLLSAIGSSLAYAALELVSFVGLSLVLRRKLQLSPLHQLAFVIHSQWNLVQSKLVLWVMFTVQISLEHFGYDYSFRFKWLKAP